MNANQPQEVTTATPETGMSRRMGNAVFVLCAVFLVSFIFEAGFQAFTRTIPAWLLWVQVGIITAIFVPAILDLLQRKRFASKMERWHHWYQLILSVFFLVSLYWVMLFANVRPIDKIMYPGLVFVLGVHLGRWLFARLGRQVGKQTT